METFLEVVRQTVAGDGVADVGYGVKQVRLGRGGEEKKSVGLFMSEGSFKDLDLALGLLNLEIFLAEEKSERSGEKKEDEIKQGGGVEGG